MGRLRQNKPVNRAENKPQGEQIGDIYRSHEQLWNKVNKLQSELGISANIPSDTLSKNISQLAGEIKELDAHKHLRGHSMHDVLDHSNITGAPSDDSIFMYDSVSDVWRFAEKFTEIITVDTLGQTDFVLTHTPVSPTTVKMLPDRGIEQLYSLDFTVSGNTVTYIGAPPTMKIGWDILFSYYKY